MSDKRATYVILASIIFVGIVGVSQGQGLFELNDVNPFTPTTSFGYLGHVTAILKDSDGNIQGYFQTDNDIMDRGLNCASDLVFDTTFVSATCNIVRFIAIGSSTEALDAIDTNLFDKTTNGNVLATLTATFSSETFNFSPDLILENTFTILAADAGVIAEAGLFDSSTESIANMFARTLIGPFTMVSEGSQVEVVWTIHVD